MKFEGTTGVETLLNNLPSVFADQTAGVSNGATGTATVNLRDLGAKRNLVLVDGTRLMPGDPVAPVADLNQIPAALVDHVEVLTGGASAVYGSDAMAGVINFVMRKDFEGIEFDGQYGIDQADNSNSYYRGIVNNSGFPTAKENIWDGATTSGTVIMGTNAANGKANITAYIGYQNTEAVWAGARDFSACTIGGTSSHACAGSSNYNRWFSIDNLYGGAPYDYFQTGTGKQGSGAFTPYTGANNQHFNYGALNYLQRPDTRYEGGFFGHYDVNKELEVYTNFMFTDDNTVGQIASRGLFLGTGVVSGYADQVNCSNPLMTAQENQQLCGLLPGDALVTAGGRTYYGGQSNITPGQSQDEIGRRMIENGNLDDDLRHTSYRVQIGAKGDLGDGWNYDVYAQYGTSVFQETQTGWVSVSKIQNALQVVGTAASPSCVTPGQPANPCVPLDIFNGIGSVTPAMLKYIGVPTLSTGYTEEQIISGSLTGDLGAYGIQSPLAKSPVAVSVGSEYRAEYLAFNPDEESLSNDLDGAGGPGTTTPRSGFNVKEAFGELKVPLIQEKPFAEDLSANLGYRYSSYSAAGSVSAYKYGLEYQPVDDFRVRASYERAVRAPNVLESFSPDAFGLYSGIDPCATSTAGQCATVKNAGTAFLACPANQCNDETGGNNSLRPEISDTRTAGIVFTPTFFDGFTATVDWFDIDVSSAIGSVGANQAVNLCYNLNLANYCSLIHRNGAGQLYGGGFVSNLNQNLGYEKTTGADFEMNYNANLDDWHMTSGYGSLQFQFVGTYLDTFTVEGIPGLQANDVPVPGHPGQFTGPATTSTYDCAGLYGLTCGVPLPKWRHRLRTTWNTPWDVDFSVNWRYLSWTKFDGNVQNPFIANNFYDRSDATINSYYYIDLAADWNVRTGVDLHFGVNNVFDRLPPTLTTNALPVGPGNDNTFPGTYDSLGRTFFIGATIKY
jgi:outer membrane receptor protein involved in Fe transport